MKTFYGSGQDAPQGPNTRFKSQANNLCVASASRSTNNNNTVSCSINTSKNSNHAGQSILIDNTFKALGNLIALVLKPGMNQKVIQLLRDIKGAFLSLEEKVNQFK